MSLNKSEKQTVVTDVAAQAARSQTLALAEYRGLTVAHLDVLRKQARDKGREQRPAAIAGNPDGNRSAETTSLLERLRQWWANLLEQAKKK